MASEGFSLQGVANEATRRALPDGTQGLLGNATHGSPLHGPEKDRSLAGSLSSTADRSQRSRLQYPPIDLVSLGVISAETAVIILRYFFDHMNPLIAILDEDLHGYPQVVRRSKLLFSVILAVSARVCRPEIHMRAAQAADTLLSLAFDRNTCDIEFVQALSITVFWRHADDDSGWRKTGYAIRMGYELGLHRQRSLPLPADPKEAREVLNRERTWIRELVGDILVPELKQHSELCCADINFSLQCSLPQMIVDGGSTDIGWWFREHSSTYPCASESVLHPSLLLLRIVREHAELIRLQSKGAEFGVLLDRVEMRHEQWQADWINPGSPRSGSLTEAQRSVIVFASRHLSFKITEFRLELTRTDYETTFARAKDAVLGVMGAFVDLGRIGMLPYCQDMVFIGLVSCVTWLCNRVSPSTDADVQMIQARVDAVTMAVDGIHTGATDIGGRTSRLLRAVCRPGDLHPSGEASRRPSMPTAPPMGEAFPSSTALDFDFSAYLESQLVPQDFDFWSGWLQT